MSEEAHTPGPWTVNDGGDELGHYIGVWATAPKVAGACEPLICNLEWDDAYPHMCSTDEARANARLIAAAPELLGAAQAVIRCDDAPDDANPGQQALAYEYAIRDLRRAISKAKATGAGK